jgi:hypothetical protein
MKTKILFVVSLAALAACLHLLAGCSGGGSGVTDPAPPGAATPTTQVGATASQAEALGGQVEQLLQQLTDANAAGDSLDDVDDLQ